MEHRNWVDLYPLLFLILVLTITLVTLILIVLPDNTFYTGDSGMMLIQIKSYIMNRWRSINIIYPGEFLDPEHKVFDAGFLYSKDRRLYGAVSLTFTFLSSFPFWFFGYKGLYLITSLSLLLTSVFVYLITLHFSNKKTALFASFLIGFGSPLIFYGVELRSHTLVVMLCTLSILLIFKSFDKRKYLNLILSGISLGISYSFRVEILFFIAAIILSYFFIKGFKKNTFLEIFTISIGVIIIVLPLSIFYHYSFGYFLGPHAYNYTSRDPMRCRIDALAIYKNYPPVEKYLLTRIGLFNEMICPYSWFIWVSYFILTFLVLFISIFNIYFKKISKLFVLLLPFIFIIIFLKGIHTGSNSIVMTFPAILFVLFILFPEEMEYKSKKIKGFHQIYYLFFVPTVFIFLIIITTWVVGTAQWGPRSMFPAFPPLAIFLSLINEKNFEDKAKKNISLIFYILLIISFVVQVAGIRALVRGKTFTLQAVNGTKTLTSKSDVIITDINWFPVSNAAIYYDRYIFFVDSEKNLQNLLFAIDKKNIYSFFYVYSDSSTNSVYQNLIRNLIQKVIFQQGYTIESIKEVKTLKEKLIFIKYDKIKI